MEYPSLFPKLIHSKKEHLSKIQGAAETTARKILLWKMRFENVEMFLKEYEALNEQLLREYIRQIVSGAKRERDLEVNGAYSKVYRALVAMNEEYKQKSQKVTIHEYDRVVRAHMKQEESHHFQKEVFKRFHAWVTERIKSGRPDPEPRPPLTTEKQGISKRPFLFQKKLDSINASPTLSQMRGPFVPERVANIVRYSAPMDAKAAKDIASYMSIALESVLTKTIEELLVLSRDRRQAPQEAVELASFRGKYRLNAMPLETMLNMRDLETDLYLLFAGFDEDPDSNPHLSRDRMRDVHARERKSEGSINQNLNEERRQAIDSFRSRYQNQRSGVERSLSAVKSSLMKMPRVKRVCLGGILKDRKPPEVMLVDLRAFLSTSLDDEVSFVGDVWGEVLPSGFMQDALICAQ